MIAILLAAAAPPPPPPQDMAADIRCLIASSALTQADAAGAKTTGLFAQFFWFGRVDGRVPDRELARRLDAEARRMTTADIEAELVRCGADMQARGAVMAAIGKEISEAEAERRLC